MHKGSELYTRKKIARLSPEFQDDIKIRNIKKQGTTEAEKGYEARLGVTLEKKLRNKDSCGRSKPLDFKVQQEKADEAETDHDKDWCDKDIVSIAPLLQRLQPMVTLIGVGLASLTMMIY